MSFLKTLRSKPQHVKAQLAFLGAFMVTFVIAGLWALSLPTRLHFVEDATEKRNKNEASEGADGGLSELMGTAREQLGAALEGTEETSDAEPDAVPDETFAPTSSSSTLQAQYATSTPPALSETATETPETRAPRRVLIATTSSQKSEQKTE